MPLSVTLFCASCTRPSTEGEDLSLWYAITPATGSITPRVLVCGETCLASWAMRQQLEREQGGKPATRESLEALTLPFDPEKPPLGDDNWGADAQGPWR